mmetsp:Transcript_3518/g.8622  ORF Transcript_3518/g.8622 Transcript_3518/m.8622 type:complete len:217 (-) Transcript_3518:453-1103(-)
MCGWGRWLVDLLLAGPQAVQKVGLRRRRSGHLIIGNVARRQTEWVCHRDVDGQPVHVSYRRHAEAARHLACGSRLRRVLSGLLVQSVCHLCRRRHPRVGRAKQVRVGENPRAQPGVPSHRYYRFRRHARQWMVRREGPSVWTRNGQAHLGHGRRPRPQQQRRSHGLHRPRSGARRHGRGPVVGRALAVAVGRRRWESTRVESDETTPGHALLHQRT